MQLMVGNAHTISKYLARQYFIQFVAILLLPSCFSLSLELCGGLFFRSGTITSPNYPLTYPPNHDCVWRLQAQGGDVILLRVEEIEIDPNGDGLYIYVNSTLTMRLFGTISSFNLTLGPSVKLQFISDGLIGNKGFLLHWDTGSTCVPGREYFNGYICVPCTEQSTYISRKVRNCSQDKDAEYAEPGSELSLPSDVVNEKPLPSEAFPQENDPAENKAHRDYAAPVVGAVCVLAALAVPAVYIFKKYRRRRI